MDEQLNTPEKALTESDGTPDSPLQEFAKAFRASTERSEPAEQATEAAKPPVKVKPKDLRALAETLKLDVKELYDVQIPSAREGAEPYTLGKLKDLAGEQDSFAVRTLRFEEQARKREAEFVQTEQELKLLVDSLPKEALKPEALKAVRDRHAQSMQREREKALDVIPEWQDAQTRTAELEGMVAHLKTYGFPETYLLQNFSAQTLKYVRDNWQREERVRKALESVAERKPAAHGASRKSDAPKRTPAKASTIEAQRVADFVSTLQQAASR